MWFEKNWSFFSPWNVRKTFVGRLNRERKDRSLARCQLFNTSALKWEKFIWLYTQKSTLGKFWSIIFQDPMYIDCTLYFSFVSLMTILYQCTKCDRLLCFRPRNLPLLIIQISDLNRCHRKHLFERNAQNPQLSKAAHQVQLL